MSWSSFTVQTKRKKTGLTRISKRRKKGLFEQKSWLSV